MIVPIVMLAIRDSASDMSPYVRKTAAHAIPKLYSLDPEQKEELVSIIDKLLSDKAPLVVGSAAMAFSEVCGERMSLIHRSYRFSRALFEPFLKSFFVRNSDPTHIKLLKLEILTNLATEASAGVILREFQTYVTCSDKAFAGATIQAIGRLAVAIHSETETCLNGLLHLLSSKDEWVVCEAVVVVKRVVGGGATSARAAVSRAAKLLRSDRLAGAARAAAVWLVAEHGAPHPRAAAVLAHMAASFADQDELVKLQLLSLAVKLSVTQPDTLPVCRYVVSLARYDDELVKLQLLSLAVKLSVTQPDTLPVCRYVVSLARYDVSYDVRDRARMLRRFIEPQPGKQLHKYVADIFLPEKPKPDIQSSFKDRGTFTVGSLSQYIGTAAGGYRPLPAGPRSTLAAHLRDTAPAQHIMAEDTHDAQKNKSFYSEPESSGSGSASSSSEDSSSEASSDDANEVTNIRLHKKTLTGSRNIHEFAPIPLLSPSATATVTLGVDFADTIQPIEFTIISSIGEVPVSITPPVGELMRAVTMSQSRWDAEHKKLRGMTECDKKAVKVEDEQTICKRVFETANVAAITSTGDFLRFAGRMMSSQDLVLLSVRCEADSSRVTANCQNMAIASLLANQVAQALART
ncbi:hypothetical protein B5X24_HaOG206817 [Helicoverpa armigera]|uniref:AP-3 complex subunit beta n=1 Tax=Helicoverpa armigera TaxID=29058 RepID=A0A2W1BQ74_HELAM|nr:hypothetical protein B5X24_HaOG206817 [Helicoverpa armigera]